MAHWVPRQYNLIARLLGNGLSVLFWTFENSVTIVTAPLLANRCLAERLGLWKDSSAVKGELGSLHLSLCFMKVALYEHIGREKLADPKMGVEQGGDILLIVLG